MKPVVAIVGRPNAGKSTLFNRLTKTRDALVDSAPGVTRDRHYGQASFNDVDFTVIDTGGFYFSDSDRFVQKTHDQVRYAIADADAIIALFDGAQGVSPYDHDIMELLRTTSKPVIFTANKMDHIKREESLGDFYAFGIDEVLPISAEHGHGIYELMEKVVAVLPETGAEEISEPIRVAIVGRPNVGKSSLINRISGEDRMIVSEVPGTTRDAIDTMVEVNHKRYRIVDTAGIRKKSRVSERLEKYAVVKAMDAIERCDIALIMIDAADGIVEQDIKIAGYAYEKGRACIFLLNKWDLVEKDDNTFKQYKEELKTHASYMHYTPFLTISALDREARAQNIRDHRGRIRTVYPSHRNRALKPHYPGRHIPDRTVAPSRPAPEVLLRHPDRDKAANDCVLCELPGRRPFFLPALPGKPPAGIHGP